MSDKPHYRRTSSGETLLIRDGYQNLVANLGTERDKAAFGTYNYDSRGPQQYLAAYRSAWLPRKIVDIPATDATRRWRSWNAGKDEITAIEAVEKRLQLQRKMRDAHILARLYGGAAIYISTKAGDLTKPLQLEREGRAGINHLTVIPRQLLIGDRTDDDLNSAQFGLPEHFQIIGGAQPVKLHHSRLVRLIGAPIPTLDPFANEGWGDSVLDALFDSISQADGTAANVAALVHEAKIDVIHIPRLMELIATAPGEASVMKYIRAAMTAKSVNGALILDGGDTSKPDSKSGGTLYDTKNQSFSGLDAVWDRFLQAVSGAADIPATRLLGQSPAGLNSTGESDLRNYYDRIQSYQTLDLEPAMANLDQMIVWEATGKPMDDIHFNWRSLWQTTDRERADLGKVVSEIVVAMQGTSLWADEILSKAGANAMIETGALPGLEAAMDEYEEEREAEDVDPDLADDPISGPAQPRLRVVGDAKPRPLYVRRNVLNGEAILRWARSQGFEKTLKAEDLHVTIAYSRQPVDWMAMGQSYSERIEISSGGPRVMEQLGEAKVLLIAADELRWRHEQMTAAGASWDFPDYQPHITISYDANAPELDKVQPYRGPIVLGPEIFEELDENWRDKVTGDDDADH